MESILIVCGAGASSTFLASRMRSLASSRGLSIDVRAANEGEIPSRLVGVDVLLVGPHLAPSFDALAASASEHGVAAALLPANAFGPTGAEDALALATSVASTPA
jgi:PTS system cellobiose-specific IIB component